MASKHRLDTCHRCRSDNCRGTMKDPASAYGVWAYWCKESRNGWSAKPCRHLSRTSKQTNKDK